MLGGIDGRVCVESKEPDGAKQYKPATCFCSCLSYVGSPFSFVCAKAKCYRTFWPAGNSWARIPVSRGQDHRSDGAESPGVLPVSRQAPLYHLWSQYPCHGLSSSSCLGSPPPPWQTCLPLHPSVRCFLPRFEAARGLPFVTSSNKSADAETSFSTSR